LSFRACFHPRGALKLYDAPCPAPRESDAGARLQFRRQIGVVLAYPEQDATAGFQAARQSGEQIGTELQRPYGDEIQALRQAGRQGEAHSNIQTWTGQ